VSTGGWARKLPGHFVRTVPQLGWATIKNGKLLRLAEKDFDVFITVEGRVRERERWC
jgi:hypothetical protein